MSGLTILTLALVVCFVHCYDTYKIRKRLPLLKYVGLFHRVKAECLEEEVCPFLIHCKVRSLSKHLFEQSNSFLISLRYSLVRELLLQRGETIMM